MKKDERRSILVNIASLKKELMTMRVKSSSGEAISDKDLKNKKKEVARLFTKLNAVKA